MYQKLLYGTYFTNIKNFNELAAFYLSLLFPIQLDDGIPCFFVFYLKNFKLKSVFLLNDILLNTSLGYKK